MPLVNVMVNSRAYTIACDDGEEEHLKELAAHVDAKAREVLGSVGQVGDARMLLMAALLMPMSIMNWRVPGDMPATAKKIPCMCGRKRRKAPLPMPWKALPSGWKTLPPGSHTPKLSADGHCLARQVAMPRGLNCTHRELSLVWTLVLTIWRPPALAGP